MRLFVLALLAGCGPAVAVITDPNSLDTGVDVHGGDDTGGLDDTASIDDTDPGDDEPGDDDPVTLIWEGERTFTFEEVAGRQCVETVGGTGREITDDETWADAVAACEGCDHVFLVELDAETMCVDEFTEWGAVPLESPVVRGIVLGGDDVTVWSVRSADGAWSGEPLAEGTGGDGSYTYAYEGKYRWVDYAVDGSVTLVEE